MTVDIVNLRRARKVRARGEAADVATANRLKYGRSSAERNLSAARSALAQRRLDEHRIVDTTAADENAGNDAARV